MGSPVASLGRGPMRAARRFRRRLVAAVVVAAGGAAVPLVLGGSSAAAAPLLSGYNRAPSNFDGLGIAPGKVKHVWLIILENKSYDATFTGLNNNTFLWQTLPSQGVLLKNYYGTGHFSQDNYLSMVAGQAPITDTQSDCPQYTNAPGAVSTTGNLLTNPNFGQFVSAAGPNAAPGQMGCVYPSSVPTVFNQLDKARVSWKGYAQDLTVAAADSPQHSTGVASCGAPFAAPGTVGDGTHPSPGAAGPTDQYVPKHFPFPWFHSLLDNPQDCNATHIADVFDPANGLFHDLQHERTTPAFSWITPNNCSDAHDAVCHGNNLSGGFSDPNTPKAPVNFTGGLYAADLFLAHVIPEIEASPAFRDGGLIDVTFDEAFPPFTYTGNSFADSTDVLPNASTSLGTDAAGETLFGHAVHSEPSGPNTPLLRDSAGNELYPGPGDNSFIDRPANCLAQTVPPLPAGTCLLGGGGRPPAARTDAGAAAAAGTSTIADNAILADDLGRAVTGAGIPAGSFVGPVTHVPVAATAPAQSGGFVSTGSFTLIDSGGDPVLTTGAVAGIMLAARTAQDDPLFTATGATPGGGDTGSVLISPFIKPGTESLRYYNHYSWLRTIEDLFAVGATSGGLDGEGHIGYAAQPGLAPFGRDVFTNARGAFSHPRRHARRTIRRAHHHATRHPARR
jgi:Phosphoesterase family